MEKPTLDYNHFLNELDSRDVLEHFDISNFTVGEKDAQNLTYEYVSSTLLTIYQIF